MLGRNFQPLLYNKPRDTFAFLSRLQGLSHPASHFRLLTTERGRQRRAGYSQRQAGQVRHKARRKWQQKPAPGWCSCVAGDLSAGREEMERKVHWTCLVNRTLVLTPRPLRGHCCPKGGAEKPSHGKEGPAHPAIQGDPESPASCGDGASERVKALWNYSKRQPCSLF